MKAGKCSSTGVTGLWASFGSIAPILSALSVSMAGERTVDELCDELDRICRGGESLDDGDARSKVSFAGTIAGRIREAHARELHTKETEAARIADALKRLVCECERLLEKAKDGFTARDIDIERIRCAVYWAKDDLPMPKTERMTEKSELQRSDMMKQIPDENTRLGALPDQAQGEHETDKTTEKAK